MSETSNSAGEPLLEIEDLCAYLKLGDSTVYDRLNKSSPRYDPDFPKPIKLSGRTNRWRKSDVDAWIERCSAVVPGGLIESPNAKRLSLGALPKEPRPTETVALKLGRRSERSKKQTEQYSDYFLRRSICITDLCLVGAEQNRYLIEKILKGNWTPAMGAMLASGIRIPRHYAKIPEKGVGIDGKSLGGARSSRLFQARSILAEWEECELERKELGMCEEMPKTFSALQFIQWCDESGIDTEWLRLIRELMGCPVPETIDLVPARVALMLSQSYYNELRPTEDIALKPVETGDERRERLRKRAQDLKMQGEKKFIQVLMKEEGVSRSRITQLLSSKKQSD